MKITLRNIMTDQVYSVDEDTVLLEIKDLFDTHNFHHIPVLDTKAEVVGMISRLDYNMILDHFTIFRVDKAEKTNKRFLGALIAKDIMSRNLAIVSPDMTIDEANKIFLENLIHALPVVENHKLIGIVTPFDVIRYYSEMAVGQKMLED
ncbi:MAG: CBS domain-containing protein [Saprospiraceae bacterium]|nr:CBS domain-containing protein [Saprospiraceae bacterium]